MHVRYASRVARHPEYLLSRKCGGAGWPVRRWGRRGCVPRRILACHQGGDAGENIAVGADGPAGRSAAAAAATAVAAALGPAWASGPIRHAGRRERREARRTRKHGGADMHTWWGGRMHGGADMVSITSARAPRQKPFSAVPLFGMVWTWDSKGLQLEVFLQQVGGRCQKRASRRGASDDFHPDPRKKDTRTATCQSVGEFAHRATDARVCTAARRLMLDRRVAGERSGGQISGRGQRVGES